jgi:ubiquinone/menaquinone biosynthesis C-methylase UbiE
VPEPDLAAHFDAVAPAYAGLRDTSAGGQITDALVRVADLAGRSVLDVGCGPGRLLADLASRHKVRPMGVDRSQAMIAAARAELGQSADLRIGVAEDLPYREGEIERAVTTMAVHLMDRSRAFAELHRVLGDDGRLAIATADPAYFDRGWMAPFFPSYAAADRGRFPTSGTLRAELHAAAFSGVSGESLAIPRVLTRQDALDRLRQRAFSTFEYLSDDEWRHGIRLAEASLPDTVHFTHYMLIVAARR